MVDDSEVIQLGNLTVTARAFIGTNPTGELITSGLRVIRSESPDIS